MVDASITGNVATNVIATPRIVIGFVGAELVVDPAYIAALKRCYAGMLDKYVEVPRPSARRADDRHLGDGRLAVEDLFDLGGEEILAER